MNFNPYEGLASGFGGGFEERRKRRRKHSAGATAGWQLAGSSIDLDFANARYFGGNLTDLLSCSRASSGYVTNGDGTLTNVPPNVLRVSGSRVRENLTLYSNDNSQGNWTGDSNAKSQVVGPADPVGGTTINRFTSTTGGTFYPRTLTAISSGQTYTISAWVRSFGNDPGTSLKLAAYDGAWRVGSPITLTSTFTRYSFTFTAAGDSSVGQGFELAGTGVAGWGLEVYGFQVELGSTMTSYIPTGATAVSVTDSSGAGLGLLVEESRTNVARQSQALATGPWLQQGNTTTNNAAIAPDGTMTATTIRAAAGPGVPEPYLGASDVTYSNGVNQAISVYVKADSWPYVVLSFGQSPQRYFAVVFDLSNGGAMTDSSVGALSGTIVSATATALANGWFRLTLIGNMVPGALNYNIEIGPAASATGNPWISYGEIAWTPVGTEQIQVWGVQWEVDKSFATSYIPTTSVAVTRAADVVSLIGLADTTIRHAGASHFVSMAAMPLTTNRYMLGSDHGSVGMAIPGTGSVGTDVILYDGTVVLHATPGGGLTPANPLKTAMGWNAAGRSIVSANGTVVTNASAQVIDPSAYYLGSDNTSGFVDTYILRVALWNSRLADVALKGLTV